MIKLLRYLFNIPTIRFSRKKSGNRELDDLCIIKYCCY